MKVRGRPAGAELGQRCLCPGQKGGAWGASVGTGAFQRGRVPKPELQLLENWKRLAAASRKQQREKP